MGGGLESRCIGHVYGADGAVRLVLSSWDVVRVSDQLKQGVRITWALGGISFFPWWRYCIYVYKICTRKKHCLSKQIYLTEIDFVSVVPQAAKKAQTNSKCRYIPISLLV